MVLLLGAALAAAPIILIARAAAAQTPSAVAGSYQITVCKVAPCAAQDTVRRVVWGTLVLGDTLFTVTEVADRVNSNRLRNTYVRGPLSGCLVMTRRSRHARTYAGLGGLARTSWSATGDASPRVTVSLFSSPDAGHTMTATFANGGRISFPIGLHRANLARLGTESGAADQL